MDKLLTFYQPKGFGPQILTHIANAFGTIFLVNNEKEFSRIIHERILKVEPSKSSLMLMGHWCYKFEDYTNCKLYYQMASKLEPSNVEILLRIAHVCFQMDGFEESLLYIDKALTNASDAQESSISQYKSYIISIRDNKIRFEMLPFEQVRTVFNTVEVSLKMLDPTQDIEFGNILTELQKGIEILLGLTLGKLLIEEIQKKYSNIPNKLLFGQKNQIRRLHPLVINFLRDPYHHNLTLGNWKTIIAHSQQGKDPRNPLMEFIYSIITNNPGFSKIIRDLILSLEKKITEERNKASHRKLYKKEEVEQIIRTLIPELNKLFLELK